MRLDAVRVQLRRRNSWQALDVGILLAQRWYAPMLALWWGGASVFVALFALLAVKSGGLNCIRAMLAFWCVQPFFEYPLFFWAGHAMFGEKPRLGQTLAQCRSLFSPRFFFALLRYRFSSLRPFAWSVLALETPARSRAGQRIALLAQCKNRGALLWFMLAVELLLTAAIMAAAQNFLFPELGWGLPLHAYGPTAGIKTFFLVYMLVSGLLAPFSASCGFMLYISRRVELEAWDIELGFRNLHARLQDLKR